LRMDGQAPLGSASRDGGLPQESVGLIAAGGLLGALAASSCCILPLVFFMLGIGGAWIGRLTALEPYQPAFIAITLGLLASGYYLVYRRRKPACAEGTVCAHPLSRRMVKLALWAATALIAAAIAFPYVAPALLGADPGRRGKRWFESLPCLSS
jgi:mercuric ion transport protein